MPNFTYVNNIPAASDIPANSQSDMKTNCESVNSILGGNALVDMIGFGDAEGGFHRQLTLPVPASPPVSAASQTVIYSGTDGSNSEIYLLRDAVATAIQLTKGTVSIAGNVNATAKGHSFIPGGLIIQWGTFTASDAGTAFTFDISFTVLYSFTMTPQGSSAIKSASNSLTISGGTVYTEGDLRVNYIAIGT